MTLEVFPRQKWLGVFFIILGMITLMVTYKYVVPTGSIFLIASGLFLIFWKRFKMKEYKL